jgi:hypothetical protein
VDFLLGEGQNVNYDKDMVNRFNEVERLPSDAKQSGFDFMNQVIRDFKAKQAYAS